MTQSSIGARIGLLVVATSAIQLANGFFGTFIGLRVVLEGFDAAMAGLVLSSYFAGFTAGAFFCERIIQRFGHIRSYAAFGGVAVAATSAMPLLVEPSAWILLRASIGFGCAAIFVTTESWLNAKAAPRERGFVFSIYMLGTFTAIALGQLLIARADIETASPFNVIIVLFAMALALMSITRAEQPEAAPTDHLPFRLLVRTAPVAVAGAALSGLISSAFYSLVPVWMQDEGIERASIGIFMLVAVLGGLAFQIPVGRLSDRFDRLIVLGVLSVSLSGVAVALPRLPHSPTFVLPFAAVLGGFMSTLYPVCVANAHDRMPADRVVAVSSWLILASGCGSVMGPLIGMSLLRRIDIDGVFYLIAAAALLLSVVALARDLTSAAPLRLARTFDLLPPQPTPIPHDPIGTANVRP
jgi:MFS family permease